MKKTSSKLAYLAALLYASITGFSFLFTKIALENADAIDILAFRFSTAFIAILIFQLFNWSKSSFTKEKVQKILPLALMYPLAFFCFQTFGLKYASSSETGILLASIPIFTLILASHFLQEETNIWQKLSIILSVLGVVFIVIMKSSTFEINNLKGIFLILLSALSFSSYSIMARKLTKDFSSLELSYIMIIISFICFNTLAIIKHLFNGTILSFFMPMRTRDFIVSMVYLGVLSSFFTSLLSNYVLSKIEASKMSVFSNLGTVISIIAGSIFLGEEIFYYHIIGSVLIIGGVIGTNFLDNKKINKLLNSSK